MDSLSRKAGGGSDAIKSEVDLTEGGRPGPGLHAERDIGKLRVMQSVSGDSMAR